MNESGSQKDERADSYNYDENYDDYLKNDYGGEADANVMIFDMNDLFTNLPPECLKLEQLIRNFQPIEIKLDNKLKPYIPDYIPCIGEVDAFIKPDRPDKLPETLGLAVLVDI